MTLLRNDLETRIGLPVEHIEHRLIPMPDGCRLAARIWLPRNARRKPVPAILEYLPYRKRDLTRRRDAVNHPYLASHGYACVRVDLRGTGDSDGVLLDQYRKQEHEDGVEVIRWLTEQAWCDGSIGMMGISWGGFNALQIAALRPRALKAIVTACSTDDLYVDNMHYMGGCLLTDNLSEATTMFSAISSPPDPELVGDQWRSMWMERLENTFPWLETWLRHQHRDEYWHHGSVCQDYGAIQCPVLAVGGWSDGYTNAIFRLLENLEVPRLGLIGPWGHKYPHQGVPGPAIGFLQEMVRWWDHWLKGRDTGIMEEPMLRAWMQYSVPPTTHYDCRPGRWVGEDRWPSPGIRESRFRLTSGRALLPRVPGDGPGQAANALAIQSPLSVGLFAGKWCSYTAAPDLPHDQREEDGGALVFETGVLDEAIEILGMPALELEVSATRPEAMMAVRLSDVAPDDKATRVTYGLLNLAHRDSHREPEALQVGKRYRVKVELNHVAQVFPAGHRLRVSISTSYWPLAWPSPEAVRLEIHPDVSELVLPSRLARDEDELIGFPEPEGAPETPVTMIEPPHHNWLVHRDLAEDLSTLEVIKDEGSFRLEEIDLEVSDCTRNWYSYRDDDFRSPRGETQTERGFRRGDWSIRTTTRTVLTADPGHFHIHAELDAWEGGERIFSRNWQRDIPRDHV